MNYIFKKKNKNEKSINNNCNTDDDLEFSLDEFQKEQEYYDNLTKKSLQDTKMLKKLSTQLYDCINDIEDEYKANQKIYNELNTDYKILSSTIVKLREKIQKKNYIIKKLEKQIKKCPHCSKHFSQ